MKLIRLTRGTDKLDARAEHGLDGAKTTPGPNGADIPRFVFYSLEGRARPADLRGWAHEVTNDEYDALMTFPGVVFEEVTPEQADADRAKWLSPGGSEIGRLIFGAEAYRPPAPVPIAESVARSADVIRAEVQREVAVSEAATKAAAEVATDSGETTPPATGRKAKA